MRFCLNPINLWETRKNSNRMRTARLLPVSPSMHCSGGRCICLGGVPACECTCPGRYTALGGGVPAQGVYLPRRVYLPRGVGVPAQGGVPSQEGVPSGGCTCLGVYLVGGVYLPGRCVPDQGGVPAQGLYKSSGCTYPGGCTCPGGYLPRYSTPHLPMRTEFLIHAIENITWPQTSFADGNDWMHAPIR